MMFILFTTLTIVMFMFFVALVYVIISEFFVDRTYTKINIPDLPAGSSNVIPMHYDNPVLILTKQDDLRIYHPDNTVEYLSYDGSWDRVAVQHKSVYEYSKVLGCIILEELK